MAWILNVVGSWTSMISGWEELQSFFIVYTSSDGIPLGLALSLGLSVQHVFCIVLNYHWLDIRDNILLRDWVNCSPSLKNAHLCNVWWDNSPNILSPFWREINSNPSIYHPSKQSIKTSVGLTRYKFRMILPWGGTHVQQVYILM